MNIKAVARKARVSTATVSRTINGSTSVRPKTAERVRKAIEALGFHPNVNARALGSGKSSLYGLIISDVTNPFFPELVKAFEDIAVTHQKDILIANTGYDPERLQLCVRRMLQRKVDGVAIMTSEMDDRLLHDFSSRKIPMVLLDTARPGPGIHSVRIDHHAGMQGAVGHLAELGHQEIAFISGPLRLPSANARHQGFIDACRHHRILFRPEAVAQGDHGVEGGYTAMNELLASPRRCTAVVCSNDLTAIGAMESIYERGLRVPDDISVVGYDGIQLGAYAHPGLTTMSVPRRELATTAFLSLLADQQTPPADDAIGQEHVFTPTLVRRRSTSAPAHTAPAQALEDTLAAAQI